MLPTFNFPSAVLPTQILPLNTHLIWYCVKTNHNFMAIQFCLLLILHQCDFIYKVLHLNFINHFYRHSVIPHALLIITATPCLVYVVNIAAYQVLGNCVAHCVFIFYYKPTLEIFCLTAFLIGSEMYPYNFQL